jgi:hypothetical protein
MEKSLFVLPREPSYFCRYHFYTEIPMDVGIPGVPGCTNETNVMHFLFSLLGMKGFYMFRALPAHPQQALHKRHLVYCISLMSVGCTRDEVKHQAWCS